MATEPTYIEAKLVWDCPPPQGILRQYRIKLGMVPPVGSTIMYNDTECVIASVRYTLKNAELLPEIHVTMKTQTT